VLENGAVRPSRAGKAGAQSWRGGQRRFSSELEFVEGQIYANVWHSNRIARISPQTGEVVGWIDLTGLLSPVYRLEPEAVLNGIAYDPFRKRLFVTGKLWPLSPKHTSVVRRK
jgi:glutamine cyclotransferase